MQKTKLKHLYLASFRGASKPTTIEFDSEKKITMIFGENGTGKSSVVDAFSFLCEGRYGSLDDRSGSERKHITSICGKKEHLRVKLTTSKGGWEAKLSGNDIEVKPNQGCPDVRILRRSQILRLIDRQPKERFKELQRYIDVTNVERSEEALRTAVNLTNDELNGQSQAFSQSQAALEKLWISEGRNGASSEAWAKGERDKDLSKLKSDCAEIDRILDALSDLGKLKAEYQNEAIETVVAETAYASSLLKQRAEEQKVVGQSTALLDLLKRAREFVDGAKDLQFCPVCEQPKNGATLKVELQDRIDAMNSLSKAITEVKNKKDILDKARHRVATTEKKSNDKLIEAGVSSNMV